MSAKTTLNRATPARADARPTQSPAPEPRFAPVRPGGTYGL